MGARALVAYEQAPDEYSLHYSHWGATRGKLLRQITPDTPFADGNVESEPWDDLHAASLEEILTDVMQYGTWEAFYLVTDDWDVSMWVPVEYGEPGRGVLVPVSTYEDPESGQLKARSPRVEATHAQAVWETARDLHDDEEAAIEYVDDTLSTRYNGVQGRAASYDDPMLSTERPVPAALRRETRSLSSMTEGSL